MKKQSFNFMRLILSEYVTILLTAAKGYMLFFTLVDTTTNNSHYFMLCDVFLNCVESLLFSVMWEPAAADYTVLAAVSLVKWPFLSSVHCFYTHGKKYFIVLLSTVKAFINCTLS